VPIFIPISKNSAGRVTVTLAALAPSATLNTFYVWAQLLDRFGAPVGGIGYGLDFASISSAFCTGPSRSTALGDQRSRRRRWGR
jgi:hypothetical protein